MRLARDFRSFFEQIEEAAPPLCGRPLGLITDFDGTISAIAPTPAGATVDPRCRDALCVLVDRIDLVAVVSGRPAAEVRNMVGLDGVVYVGNHGLERWENGTTVLAPGVAECRPRIAAALAVLRGRLLTPGVVFEDKGSVLAVHYRLSTQPRAARAAIVAAATEVAQESGLALAEGKRVVELRPPVARDKGTALADLVATHRLRAVLYLGDDETDRAAFGALRRLRREGQCTGAGIAVRGPETPPAVLRAADYVVAGVAEVAKLLEWLVAEV